MFFARVLIRFPTFSFVQHESGKCLLRVSLISSFNLNRTEDTQDNSLRVKELLSPTREF